MRTFARRPKPLERLPSGVARPSTPPLLHRLADQILHLQRTIGNQAVQRLLRHGASPDEPEVAGGGVAANTDPDRGVDLGGIWDEHGNYWYADESGRVYLWTEATQQWQPFVSPDDAVKLTGRAPPDPAAEARNEAYRRHLRAPARQYGRDYGIVGAPTIMVAKVAGESFEKVQQVIPAELSVAVAPGSILLVNNSQRLREAEAEIAAEKDRRDAIGEFETALEHGDVFVLPLVVASTDPVDESAPPDPLIASHAEVFEDAPVAAGTTTKVGKPARSPARVEGFIRDIVGIYRNEIAAAQAANPQATASKIGIIAESRTLAQVDAVARARGLDPGHIMSRNFPMGVTGPRGGMVSAEMGSPHYGFVIELKKSPKAAGPMQAEGHLVSVGHSVNFPDRGVYVRIFGEKYKGQGVFRQAMGEELDKKKRSRPRGGPRLRTR